MSEQVLQFSVLEDFDGLAPQNDAQKNALQDALLQERKKLQLLAQQMQEARKEAFKEGYGRGEVRARQMTNDEYKNRLQELFEHFLTLEQANEQALEEIANSHTQMVFDILNTLLPQYVPALVQDDFFATLEQQLRARVDAPLHIRACQITATQLEAKAQIKNIKLPTIEIDETLREGDILAQRGALRYHGSAYDFLTSAVQCLKRYLNPVGES